MLKGVEVDILEARRARPARRGVCPGRLGRGERPLRTEPVAREDHRAGSSGPWRIPTSRVIEPSDRPADQPPPRLRGRLDAVLKAAARPGKMMELNAHPMRLDLDDVACAAAKGYGIPIVISTDAHSPNELAMRVTGFSKPAAAD